MSIARLKPIVIGLAFSLVGLGAVAASPDVFAKLDGDPAGWLIKTALQVPCDREIFASSDRNGDTIIDRQEFQTSGDMATYED